MWWQWILFFIVLGSLLSNSGDSEEKIAADEDMFNWMMNPSNKEGCNYKD